MSQPFNSQTEDLQGVVERLTYHSEETGYTVARLKSPRTRELVTIVGNFANLQPGQSLQLNGFWREHPKFGAQFQVEKYCETKPATITGIEKYLGSGLIKGVGPVTARRIVSHFKLGTLEIIENQIERLVEVPGIAQKRIRLIQQAWKMQKAIKEVMLFLQEHSISTTYAVKIFKQYGQDAITVVTRNPYQLTVDVYGIGFVTADAIARNLGVAPDSEFRYRSGILHVLSEAAENGHCFLPKTILVEQVIERLALPDYQPPSQDTLASIERMLVIGDLRSQKLSENGCEIVLCYKPVFFHTEQKLADRIRYLIARGVEVDKARVRAWIERFIQKAGVNLSEKQVQAVEMAASERVLIITGNPGCGKTFTVRAIVALWRAMGKSIALAAPTGRAAQRLSEVTGQPAKTVHRLLEFDPKSMDFRHRFEEPIPAECVVIDEASMLDLFLANSLIKAVSPEAQLLLVGDADQLPSVGPGNVLRDLLVSEQVPAVRLTKVFRQAQASDIVNNAHRINKGLTPKLLPVSNNPTSDCLWLGTSEPENAVQAIRDLINDFIPQVGFNPAKDVQILCPMTRGDVGTRNLNRVLQEMINPPLPDKAELTRGGMTLRVGDRVIQQMNDYSREVFNGDLGSIRSVDLEEQEVTVQFGDRIVSYDYADLNEITLAWAVTIHKSQESEYPVVILPLFMQHYLMLSRNLLYTGLTRARKLAILVGPQKAIALAVRQVKDQQRYTLLAQRLQSNIICKKLEAGQ